MAAKNRSISKAIAEALYNFDKSLVLFGLSGSHLIDEAKAIGIKTASEVFADRTYQEDGSLTPRSQQNSLIHDKEQAINQVVRMIEKGEAVTTSGKTIAIVAETICLHGDGENAVNFARSIHTKLKLENIAMKAI